MLLTQDETDALHHLGYEWWMAKSAHSILLRLPAIDDPVRNALVESMCIHLRDLIAFFYRIPHQADWSIANLKRGLVRKEGTDYIDALFDDVSKRVVHLTARRVEPASGWPVDEAFNCIGQNVSEVKAAFSDDFPSDWLGDAPETTTLIPDTGLSSGTSSGSVGVTGPIKPTGWMKP